MPYASLRDCVDDLERTGQLRRVEVEVDACLEAAEIQRRVFRARGPAVYFARVKGCRFPMVSNLFGTMERARFIFRDSLDKVRRLIELRADPGAAWKRPLRYAGVPFTLLRTRPRRVAGGPVFAGQVEVGELPHFSVGPTTAAPSSRCPRCTARIQSGPDLPQQPGMYRIQLSGGRTSPTRGGLALPDPSRHRRAPRSCHPAWRDLACERVCGRPAGHDLAAVMPLPEGVSELAFAGALGGRRVRLAEQKAGPCRCTRTPTSACSPKWIPRCASLRPFGDHLGYYSLAHDFRCCACADLSPREAIWPFTVVGRPPQEDSVFGALIHEITGPLISSTLPGVHAVNAVDAAGVHRCCSPWAASAMYRSKNARSRRNYSPRQRHPGTGQLSLAKYLFIAAVDDDPQLDVHDVSAFLQHVLARVDWRRDLHFQTQTTIDTLDYSARG